MLFFYWVQILSRNCRMWNSNLHFSLSSWLERWNSHVHQFLVLNVSDESGNLENSLFFPIFKTKSSPKVACNLTKYSIPCWHCPGILSRVFWTTASTIHMHSSLKIWKCQSWLFHYRNIRNGSFERTSDSVNTGVLKNLMYQKWKHISLISCNNLIRNCSWGPQTPQYPEV